MRQSAPLLYLTHLLSWWVGEQSCPHELKEAHMAEVLAWDTLA